MPSASVVSVSTSTPVAAFTDTVAPATGAAPLATATRSDHSRDASKFTEPNHRRHCLLQTSFYAACNDDDRHQHKD